MSAAGVVAVLQALDPLVGHGVTAWNSLLAHRAELRRIRVDMEQIQQQARLAHRALDTHHTQTMKRLAQEHEQCLRVMEYAFAQLQGKLMDREALHANMASFRKLMGNPHYPIEITQSSMVMLNEQTLAMRDLWQHEAIAFHTLAANLERRAPLPPPPHLSAPLLDR